MSQAFGVIKKEHSKYSDEIWYTQFHRLPENHHWGLLTLLIGHIPDPSKGQDLSPGVNFCSFPSIGKRMLVFLRSHLRFYEVLFLQPSMKKFTALQDWFLMSSLSLSMGINLLIKSNA